MIVVVITRRTEKGIFSGKKKKTAARRRRSGADVGGREVIYRRDAAHWTRTRTRVTNVAVELPPAVLEPLYVSSSFFTTSLGCLSYSAAGEKTEKKKKMVRLLFRKNGDIDLDPPPDFHLLISIGFVRSLGRSVASAGE